MYYDLIGQLTVIFLSLIGLAQVLDIILQRSFIPALKGIGRSVVSIWRAYQRKPTTPATGREVTHAQ